MSQYRDPEYNISAKENEYRMPEEMSGMPQEIDSPRENSIPSEYNVLRAEEAEGFGDADEKAQKKEENRHNYLKKLILQPVVAVLAAATVLTSALGIDLLGKDVLGMSEDWYIWEHLFHEESYDDPGKDDPDPRYDGFFPDLPNPDPDFSGAYAWGEQSPETSEEYLMVIREPDDEHEAGEEFYLVAGGLYKGMGIEETSLPGCTYDRSTNTLTLSNFNEPGARIDANLMGNGFKIRLVGENSIGFIRMWGAMYGGSVTFTGTGSLTVNENKEFSQGLLINAEDSQSCLMVDRYAELHIYGAEAAVYIYDSTDTTGIYWLAPSEFSGGTVYGFIGNGEDPSYVTVMDGEELSKEVTFKAG